MFSQHSVLSHEHTHSGAADNAADALLPLEGVRVALAVRLDGGGDGMGSGSFDGCGDCDGCASVSGPGADGDGDGCDGGGDGAAGLGSGDCDTPGLPDLLTDADADGLAAP
jgi:hypothetical protein